MVTFISIGNEAFADSAFLKGKVLDTEGHPVAGAKITLHDQDHDEYKTGKSDAKGEFEIEHEQCNSLTFEVQPPPKSWLTPARYAHVTGDMSKHFIVKLHPGFKVSGRLKASGQALKGLDIRFIGHEGSGHSSTVHGGGSTKTKGDGSFSLLLTPGKKTIEIRNNKYAGLAELYQHEVTITGDTELPEMTLPTHAK